VHDNQTILTELLHHKVAPPQELFVNAWGAIVAGGYGQLSDDELSLSDIAGAIKDDWDASSLYFVKDAEITPPPFVFENLEWPGKKGLTKVAEERPVKKMSSAGFNRYRAAAAILLLAVSGWMIYNLVAKQQDGKSNVATNSSSPTGQGSIKPDNSGTATVISSSPDSAVTRGASPAPGVGTNKNKLTAANNRAKKNLKYDVALIETAENQFVGKDVLFTLVNFNTTQAERLVALLDKNAERKITIDKYSYVNVSDKMADMLKTMYETKRNAKPTRKSRKAKERLEKWKKADEVNFDEQVKKNPLDIIDLSDFIFNK